MRTAKRFLIWVAIGLMLVASPVLASQHDYDISTADANTGATFRAAVNAALQALASLSSGATQPTTPYAYQLWADTTNNYLKIRNSANTAWTTIGSLSSIYLGLAATFDENSFTQSQQLKGDGLLLRFTDTGPSGAEWAIRSTGGNFEIVRNIGSEGSPTWTVQARMDVNALRIGNGTSADIDIIANNDAANKPRLRYQASGSKWQYSNDGSTFNDLGSGGSSPSAMPVGSVITFAGPSAPAGYLQCNGAAVSRTTYADLFAVIGTMYGVGNGSTTFNLPDYRGYFLRGRDNGAGVDPDRASRTNRGDGTTGDNVGTKQGHQLYSHNHSASSSINTNWPTVYGMAYVYPSVGGGSIPPYTEGTHYQWIAPVPDWLYVTTSIGNNGGNETRPANINVLYCIKY